MANFVKDNKNVHGLVLQASAKAVYELGLWGPVDTRTGKELVVSLSPPDASVWVRAVQRSILSLKCNDNR